MKTRFFPNDINKRVKAALIFTFLVASGLFVAAPSYADDRDEDSNLSVDNNQFHKGTVNFVHESDFQLIIDDMAFNLAPILRFKNATWSREQVIKRIEQDDRVELELDADSPDAANARTIISIRVVKRQWSQ